MIAALLAAAVATTSSPSDVAALPWRSIGPFRGGRVLAVEGAADSPLHFYFGAVNGGVWETRDAGRTWDPIFDDVPVGSIGALAIAPTAPNVIYVGTGEADMRSDIAQGLGLYRSDDGGRTWTARGLADTRQIARVLVDPRDADTVLVAALGHPYGPNEQRGVFRSTDGGLTWTRTLFRDADTGAVDLAFKPGDPDTVYAALWQTRRPPWSVYPPSNGPGGGLYKSSDGGKTGAAARGGAHRPGHHARGPRAGLRPDRRQGRRRPLPVRRFRRDLEQGERRSAHLAARLVLRRCHRQSEERRRGVGVRHHPAAFHRRGPHVHAAQGRSHGR
jgi:hypothetical protein